MDSLRFPSNSRCRVSITSRSLGNNALNDDGSLFFCPAASIIDDPPLPISATSELKIRSESSTPPMPGGDAEFRSVMMHRQHEPTLDAVTETVTRASSILVSDSDVLGLRNRFLQGGKVYGRVEEIQVLREALWQQVAIIISGPRGCGKTSLAKTLKVLVEGQAGGFFVTGRSNHLQLPVPYAPFIRALTALTKMILEKGREEVLLFQTAILDTVGVEVYVLARIIPELEQIIGHRDETFSSTQHTHRFTFVVRSFLAAISSVQPLVMLFDDAHWTDRSSLELLASILMDNPSPSLTVVFTVIDTLEADSFLESMFRNIAASRKVGLKRLDLGSLEEEVVCEMMADTLSMDVVEKSSRLGSVVFKYTTGHPAAVVDLCCWLQELGLLHFDKSSGQWSWDLVDIEKALSVPKDILKERLNLLPSHIQEVLMYAACLPLVDKQLLDLVLPFPVSPALNTAAFRGFLTLDAYQGVYIFDRDQVHVTTYHMIQPEEREKVHLNVGRSIWNQLDESSVERHLFAILSQLKLGSRLIDHREARIAVANLCLLGGRVAAKASDFRTASCYLDLGISLVGEQGWNDCYELTVVLHNAAAEMAMCTADFQEMNALVKTILVHAKSASDKTPAYTTRVLALSLNGKYQEALDVGRDILRSLGETLPRNPSFVQVILMAKSVQWKLSNKSNEQILRMPDIVDENKLACLQILQLLLTSAISIRPQLGAVIVLTMVKLTLKYGLSVFSSLTFATYGTLCHQVHNDIDASYRFGRLSLAMLERFGRREFLPRVYGVYYGFIHIWKNPVIEALEPLRRGYEIGLHTGDIEGAFLCGHLYCITSVNAGIPLNVASSNFQRLHSAMQSSRHSGILNTNLPSRQAIHHFMGISDDPLSPQGDLMNDDAALADAQREGHAVTEFVIRITRMQVCYVFNDFVQAEKYMVKLEDVRMSPAVFSRCFIIFFTGLVALANAKLGRNRRVNLRIAKKAIRMFRQFSLKCPENFLDMLCLLEAELSSAQGRNERAYEKYAGAIAVAEYYGTPFLVALINERTARHLVSIGETSTATRYLEHACLAYEEMGAEAKHKSLNAELTNLLKK